MSGKNRTASLLAAKTLSGEASNEEVELYDNWLNKYPQYKKQWHDYQKVWKLADIALQTDRVDSDKAWQNVELLTKERKGNRPKLISYLKYAAVMAAVVLGTTVFWMFLSYSPKIIIKNTEDKAVVEKFVLPDNSIVSLNKGSEIEYYTSFFKKQRKVILQGEAFFNVLPDTKKAFVIESGNLMIKVVGTSFNIRSYLGSKKISVDVNDGRVELKSLVSPAQIMTLKAGEGADFYTMDDKIVKRELNINMFAWDSGEIRFFDTSLYEVFEVLETLFNVEIEVMDDSIYREKLGASFSQNKLDYILNVVCLTLNLETEKYKDKYIIKRKLKD